MLMIWLILILFNRQYYHYFDIIGYLLCETIVNIMYFSEYTDEEEETICKQLKEHSLTKAKEDYRKLREKAQTNLDDIKPLSPVGLNFIEYFIHKELLNTKSKHKISFTIFGIIVIFI